MAPGLRAALTWDLVAVPPLETAVRWCLPVSIAGCGLLLRIAWFFTPNGAPDADDAVFGLMALSILDGRDYPIYFWQAHYAGAVVAYLAALEYWLFGYGAGVLKSATLPFAAGYLAVTYALALRLFDRNAALVALLCAAIQPAIPLAYSVKPVEYPVIICLNGLVLLLAFNLPKEAVCSRDVYGWFALLGFVIGLGFYVSPLIVPCVSVAILFVLRHRHQVLDRMGWCCFFAGGLIGVSPMLVYNVQNPLATFLRLGSRVLNVSKTEVLHLETNGLTVLGWIAHYVSDLPAQFMTLVQNLGPLLGLDLPGGAVVACLVVVGTSLALWHHGGSHSRMEAGVVLGRWCALVIPAALVFVWMFGLNRPRHLVIIYSVLPLGIAALYARVRATRPWGAGMLLTTLLLVAGADLLQMARIPRQSVAPLIEAAQRMGSQALYADYETAYQVMFVTRQAILVSPTAWSDSGVIADRTPHITQQVDVLLNPVYVFEQNTPQAAWFAEGLTRRGISFTRVTIDHFELYANLSAPIRSSALPVHKAW